MDSNHAKCPNCGSSEYIEPKIDNDVAYLLMGNNSIVTVTCVHCGSKFQTEAAINMVSGKTPAPVAIAEVVTVAEPEEKSSKSCCQCKRHS